MSKKRTSGIDDLVSTLVKQHGLAGSIDRARAQWQWISMGNPNGSIRDAERLGIWRTVYYRLKDMRH